MVTPASVEAANISDLARSFPPIFEADAQILVLGSMPGRASLQVRQYYAHPQNAFWGIIETIFGISRTLGYRERTVLLTRHRIALWDVLRICLRNGSLDSSIQASSILSNDFCSFFRSASDIKAVFLNGATAEREYRKRVYPSLPEQYAKLPAYRLPSTSPAMAGMTREQKIERWRLVAEVLGPAA